MCRPIRKIDPLEQKSTSDRRIYSMLLLLGSPASPLGYVAYSARKHARRYPNKLSKAPWNINYVQILSGRPGYFSTIIQGNYGTEFKMYLMFEIKPRTSR